MTIRQEQLGNITELDKESSGQIDVNNARIINVAPPVDGYDVATKNYVDTNGGGVTDHGALTGLADDDHAQYLLSNGTRALTGNLSAGTNKITNLGTPTLATDAVTKAYVDGYQWTNGNIATGANITVNKLASGTDGYYLKATGGSVVWAQLSGSVDGYNLNDIFEITKSPSGFPNRVDSIISKNDNTLTFTIAPSSSSYYFMVKGVKFVKNAIININWTDIEGIHYFYFDKFGTLQHSVNYSDWERVILGDGALVAMLYWDAVNNKVLMFNEERHGFMDGASHLHFHNSFGTQWYSGGSIDNFTVDADGSAAAHAQLSVSNTNISDEDIDFDIIDGLPQELSPIAEIPIYYRSGINGVWRMKDADVFPLIYQGTAGYSSGLKPPWNEFTGSSWQLTEISDSKYFLMHYYATTDMQHPIVGIQGQSEYNSVTDAQSNVSNEVASINNQLSTLMIERTPLGSVVFQTGNLTNAPKARVRSVSGGNYIDLRRNPVLGIAASVQSHGSLTNLDSDDHLQYLRTDGTRALTGNQSAGGYKITNLGTPTDAYDAATKGYVDNNSGINFSNLSGVISNRPELRVQYLNLIDDNVNDRITISPLSKFPKITVSAATTANINVTTASTINDGVSLSPGANLWVRAQTNPSENGIYFLSWRSGSSAYYERWTDIDNIITSTGAYLFVGGGSVRGGKAYFIDTSWNVTEIDPLSISWQEADIEDYSLPVDGSDMVPAYNRAQHAMGLGGKLYLRRKKFYTLGSQLQITRKSMALCGLGLTGTVLTANSSGGIRVRYTLTSTPAADCSPSSNITLSGVQNIDGVTGVAGTTVVLVTAQTNQAQNGLYIMQSGAWTRHPELDIASEFDRGVTTAVLSGTARGRTRWVIANDAPYVVGTTPVVYQQVTGFGAPWYPESQSGPMRFERFNIQYGGSRTESNDYHGLEGNQGFYADEVYIFNFPGSGVRIYGDVPESNSNKGYLNRVRVVNVGLSGFHFTGGDSNAWQIIGCDASGVGARVVVGDCFGFYENSFLGNYYYGCHSANCIYGGYLAFDSSNQSVFLGCYVENDSPAWISGSAMFFGANLDRLYSIWTSNTVKAVGDFIASGFNVWRCTVAGTTGGTQPSWATAPNPNDVVGTVIVDGSVTWTCWAAFSGISNKGIIARNDGIGAGQMLTRSPGGTAGLANFWGGTDGTDEMEKFSISADSGYTRKYVSSGAGTGIYGWLHTNSTSRLALGITATASIRSYGIACAPNGITVGPSFAVKLVGGLESSLPLVSTTSTSTTSGVYELGDLWFVQQADQYRPDLLRVTNKSGSNLTWTSKWYSNRRIDVGNTAPSTGVYDKGDIIRDIGPTISQKAVRFGWQLSNRAGTTTNVWSAGSAKTAGSFIKPNPSNGFIYKAIVGGTTGGSSPSFPTTIGSTVIDNTITWECWGADSLDWQAIAHPSDAYGSNLLDADENIQVSEGSWRRLLLLTNNRNKTLLTTGASKGDQIEITRLDTSAFDCNIINGGPSGGTIAVLPKYQNNFAVFQFDGTNWDVRKPAKDNVNHNTLLGLSNDDHTQYLRTDGTRETTGNFTFAQAVSAPIIKQIDETTNSTNGDSLTVQAQNATGTTSIGGDIVLQSGTGTTRDGYAYIKTGTIDRVVVTSGEVKFNYLMPDNNPTGFRFSPYTGDGYKFALYPSGVAATNSNYILHSTQGNSTLQINATGQIRHYINNSLKLNLTTSQFGIYPSELYFDNATVNPKIYQLDESLLTISDNLTVQAQNNIVTGSVGGDLLLQSGQGTTRDGYVKIKVGNTDRIVTDAYSATFSYGGSTGNVIIRDLPTQSTYAALFMGLGSTTLSATNYTLKANNSLTELNAPVTLRLSIGGNVKSQITTSTFGIIPPLVTFDYQTNSPVINQTDDTRGDGYNGDPLTIQAQNSTAGTTTIGGNLILQSGTGIAKDGYVKIKVGNTDRIVTDAYVVSCNMHNSSATIGLAGTSLIGQTADITTTDLITSPSVGLYALDIYMLCTTAGSAGTATLTIGWTDDVGTTTTTPISGFSLSSQGRITARQLIRVSSGNITYAVSRAGVTGSPQYALYMQLERIR